MEACEVTQHKPLVSQGMEISPKRAQNPISHQNTRAPESLLGIHRGPAQHPNNRHCSESSRGVSHILQKSNGFIFLFSISNFFSSLHRFWLPPTDFLQLLHWGMQWGQWIHLLWVSQIHTTFPCKDSHEGVSVPFAGLCSASTTGKPAHESCSISMSFYDIFTSFFNPIPCNCREQLDLQHWTIQECFFLD